MKTLKSFRKRLWQQLATPHLAVDLLILVVSIYLSLFLRVGDTELGEHLPRLHFWMPIIVSIQLVCLVAFNCYSIIWRYFSISDVTRLGKATVVSMILILSLTFFAPKEIPHLPRTVYLIDTLLSAFLLMGARLLRRIVFETGEHRSPKQKGKNTIIFGAGQNGRLLAQRFRIDRSLNMNVLGFVDDDPRKQGHEIIGIPVLGTRRNLKDLIVRYDINQLIIAIPSLSGDVLREIVEVTYPFKIKPRITPNLVEGPDAHAKNVEIYRELDLRDLLNRKPHNVDLESTREMVHGKTVLVTGAGGSIGSELARQIFHHQPYRLLLLDHSEFNLYEIDKQLRHSPSDSLGVVPLLIDIKDRDALSEIFQKYKPDIVFHAAAYKHVHLVEANANSSILNNVLGTKNLLDLSVESGTKTFVMISTDKAVNPVGIMGATKRACELLVSLKAIETGYRYCSVRFGNVLGSSGSLIPLLRSQIIEGGPVTITHKDMTRFFMLIPEAVSLVLKAATIARPGDINVLKMGEPVRIVDIATNMIVLMGKTLDEIPIVYTGLRPGEKMYEELYIRGDELKTDHPDILTLPNGDCHLISGLISGPISKTENKNEIYLDVDRVIELAHKNQSTASQVLRELIEKSSFQPTEKFAEA